MKQPLSGWAVVAVGSAGKVYAILPGQVREPGGGIRSIRRRYFKGNNPKDKDFPLTGETQ